MVLSDSFALNVLGALFIAAVGIVPCILWLVFYLKRDRHPEPKSELLTVFFLGGLFALGAAVVEKIILEFTGYGVLSSSDIIVAICANIVIIALVEEFSKYAAVWTKEQAINKNSQLDEPVDFVIYMVVAALGFATLENVLVIMSVAHTLFPINNTLSTQESALALIMLSAGRALSAILLHTLCSGIIGYYMAMTFCHRERKISILLTGFFISSCLHGLYNFFIMKRDTTGNDCFLLVSLGVILYMAFMLYTQFQQLLITKSVCDMKIVPKPKKRNLKTK